MSVIQKYKVRSVTDLKDMLNQSARLFGDKNAFLVKTCEGNYRGISYRTFKRDVESLGTALMNLGLEDSFIALIGENRYEWCTGYLATVCGTGIVVPLDKELPENEIQNLLSTSKASAVIFPGRLEESFKKMSPFLGHVKYFINMDSRQDEGNFLSFERLLEKGANLLDSGNRSFIDAPVDNEVMNMLIFTSGTTGHAKGVMLSHKNICSNITAVLSTVHVDSSDSALSILPVHHTYECSLGFLAMIYSGGTISFNEGLRHISKNLKEVKPTLLFAVPLLLESMYKKIWEQAEKQKGLRAKLKFAILLSNFLLRIFKIDIRRKLFKAIHENVGGRLRLILTGAAAIEPKVSKGFRAFGIKVLQGYGLTECSPLVTGNGDRAFKDASIGLALPGVQVRLDEEGPDGVGEIVVKGNNVMLGYYNNAEATEKVLKDGWFYTGDLGYKDRKGFFYISGRKKNVIVTKNGKNIFPEEVESYLNKSPFIQESLVWGKLDKISGETLVSAQILPNFDFIREKLRLNKPSKDECFSIIHSEIKNVNRNMPLYKRIYEFTIREEEFIKTTTKKIKRYLEKPRDKE